MAIATPKTQQWCISSTLTTLSNASIIAKDSRSVNLPSSDHQINPRSKFIANSSMVQEHVHPEHRHPTRLYMSNNNPICRQRPSFTGKWSYILLVDWHQLVQLLGIFGIGNPEKKKMRVVIIMKDIYELDEQLYY